MNVIYQASVLETIKNEITMAEIDGRIISRIELNPKEMNGLIKELKYAYIRQGFGTRTLEIYGLNIVEVFNAE